MIMMTTGSNCWQPWSTYNTGTSRQTQTLVTPATTIYNTNHCNDENPTKASARKKSAQVITPFLSAINQEETVTEIVVNN